MSLPSIQEREGYDSARRFAEVLFAEPGTVVELRAIGVEGVYGKGIVSGYFDTPEKLVAAVARLDGKANGIFATINPVEPSLLARANNRVVQNPKATTSDRDIPKRRFLLIDVDSKRASGISATEEEQEAAFGLLKRISAFLEEQGFPAPIKACSGNGGHLLYQIDLPADDDGLVSRVLTALAFLFNSEAAEVDQSVHNPARISKLYGTMACKGDSTVDRPHRRSSLVGVPKALEVVPRELLERVARMAPQQERAQARSAADGSRFDVPAYMAQHGLEADREAPWKGGRCWGLDDCPFSAEHNDGAYIVQHASGAVAAGCHHDSCAGKDWQDLRDLYEPNRQNRQKGSGEAFAGFAGSDLGHIEKNEDPIPLPDELPPVAEFTEDLLPSSVRPWVTDIANRMQCPIEFVAVAAMIALAGVLGRRIGIRPKRKDDWMVVPTLWGACIGRASTMKSPAVQEALRPLRALEVEAKKTYEGELVEYQAKAVVFEQQAKLNKAAIKKACKEKEAGEQDHEDPREIAVNMVADTPELPVRRRYLVNDATVEKLGELLNENPNGLTGFRDELIGLLKALDKDGQECARAFYLETWNGDSRFTYDRIGRGTIDIEAATLSILGCIQPGPLSAYLLQAVEGGTGDDGLMQRFQMSVWPDTPATWTNVDEYPSKHAKERARDTFERLADLDAGSVGAFADRFEPDGIRYLRFDEPAQDQFDAWRTGLELRLRSETEHPAMESHLAKYRSLVPTLALILHLASDGTGPVTLDHVQTAIRWTELLETHARRIYSVAVNPEVAFAKALLRKIQDGSVTSPFSLRDVYQKGWARLGNANDVGRGAKLLVELNWIAKITEPTEGRSKTTYRVNPLAFVKSEPVENSEMPQDRTPKTCKSPSAGFAGSFEGHSGEIARDDDSPPEPMPQPEEDSPDGQSKGEPERGAEDAEEEVEW